ncbi:MAG: DNA mismatch repair protein MutS [Clostridiales bacterium]|nr:DNA mismatch repair protein MutS [Clostridiales bacterium]
MTTFSPMMQHYLETKSKYLDCVLFYRLGDFYEMFFDDAINVSRELELTLTGKECGRENRAPMCGIPYHAGEIYASRLVQNGYKVAICEQLENPKNAKGIVKRDVIKIMTPGTITDGNLLDEKKNNYIMSVFKDGVYYGIAAFDISTGEAYATEIKSDNNFQKLINEISRFTPSELIINEYMNDSVNEISEIKNRFEVFVSVDKNIEKTDIESDKNFVPDFFNMKSSMTKLDDKFDDETIHNTFDIIDEQGNLIKNISERYLVINAIGILLKYVEETQKIKPENLNKIVLYEVVKYMALDINSRRNLELTERLKDKSKKGTLLWVLDKTETSMGGRLIRRWINDPLVNVDDINARLDAVEEIKNDILLNDRIVESLKSIYDIERLAGKISYGTVNARDLISLKNSIMQLPNLKDAIKNVNSEFLRNVDAELDVLTDIYELIEASIVEEPPLTVKEGGLIKKGYKPEIDELIEATTNGKQWLANVEIREKELTGIKTLKIGYNKIFGYYIEVSKSNVKDIPEDRYIRKQTLTTGERYITEELKKMENEILGAKEKIIALEYDEFVNIRNEIQSNAKRIQRTASAISKLDVIQGLANVANELNYCKPDVVDDDLIDIKNGRHPVVEKIIPYGDFVQNDSLLNSNENRLNIITGPNMAGKSTFMRQVALITIMAQIGSFVPAEYAHIGVVDKVFTRVGASDDLSSGESTFMVEMMEVANILKNATDRSLVILDEIGRGTSTYDGLSIAWAVAEYVSKLKCKTLFATHYHELVGLEGKIEGTKNYHITVKERGEDIIFLRKIVEGGTDESYGIHVAKLAGVPKEVTNRANEILFKLEKKNIMNGKAETKSEKAENAGQLSMYNYKLAEIASELDGVHLDSITPIEALNILQKMKDKIK